MIEIIFTGGTIGSRAYSDGSVSADPQQKYRLVELYEKRFGRLDARFSEPYCILSENLAAENLAALSAAVSTALKNKPEGVIVTHGTDTLAYSAAVLGYLFAGSEVPVVLVSSNYILGDERANGLDNLKYAVDFIKTGGGRGVFVSYRNPGQSPMIHRATRLNGHLTFSDEVHSVFGAYGFFLNERFTENNYYYIDRDNDNSLLEYSDDLDWKSADGSVLWVSSSPMQAALTIPDKTRAVLLGSYHSGTVCLSSLDGLLAQARERELPVFLVGLEKGATPYETVTGYAKRGITTLYDRAPISQYCKLLLLTAKRLPLKENMLKPCAEEV